MASPDPRHLLTDGTLDAELAALLWLLVEGSVPLVVTGPATQDGRAALAADLLSLAPGRAWSIIDAEADPPSAEALAALLRGGTAFALTQDGADLKVWLDRAGTADLPEDGLRRLGVVVVAEDAAPGLRCRAVHYLRPSERDGQGHVQRRPPAVIATWDPDRDAYEHFAWGITPELADRVDRSQADLEERQRDRQRFLAGLARADEPSYGPAAAAYLRSEPARVPAPERSPATPSALQGGLTDPKPDPHTH